MRIKKLTYENYIKLGEQEWAHRERDRLGALKRLLAKRPDANVRSVAQRPFPDQLELLKMGKIRQLRRVKDRAYGKKKYALDREKRLLEYRQITGCTLPIRPFRPHRR